MSEVFNPFRVKEPPHLPVNLHDSEFAASYPNTRSMLGELDSDIHNLVIGTLRFGPVKDYLGTLQLRRLKNHSEDGDQSDNDALRGRFFEYCSYYYVQWFLSDQFALLSPDLMKTVVSHAVSIRKDGSHFNQPSINDGMLLYTDGEGTTILATCEYTLQGNHSNKKRAQIRKNLEGQSVKEIYLDRSEREKRSINRLLRRRVGGITTPVKFDPNNHFSLLAIPQGESYRVSEASSFELQILEVPITKAETHDVTKALVYDTMKYHPVKKSKRVRGIEDREGDYITSILEKLARQNGMNVTQISQHLALPTHEVSSWLRVAGIKKEEIEM